MSDLIAQLGAFFGPEAAWAQGAPAAGGSGTFITSFAPFILIFVLFYVLLIRPQQKRQRAHREMLEEIKKGDKIITNGGLMGTIVGVTKEVISLQISDNTRVKILRTELMGLQNDLTGDNDKGDKG